MGGKRRILSVLFVAALLAGAVTGVRPAAAQQATEHSRSELTSTSGTIEKIDKNDRNITLKDAEGRTIMMQAGPNVNLEAFKTGQKVSVSYYQEMGVAISKPGEGGPLKTTTTTNQRGGVTSRQTTVTARVMSVDTNENTVVLKSPSGEHTVKVQDPDLQARLRDIKPGQNVTMTYTEALAVSVQPQK